MLPGFQPPASRCRFQVAESGQTVQTVPAAAYSGSETRSLRQRSTERQIKRGQSVTMSKRRRDRCFNQTQVPLFYMDLMDLPSIFNNMSMSILTFLDTDFNC